MEPPLASHQEAPPGPQRPNRPGQPCPFECNGRHEYKPLLNHFLKVHLAYTPDELNGDGSRVRCRYCHISVRKSIAHVHNFLQHGVQMPEALERRLEAVADGSWILGGGEESGPPSPLVLPPPAAVAAEFAEYLSDWGPSEAEESPMSDDDEDNAMATEAVCSSPDEMARNDHFIDDEEQDALEMLNGEKWALARHHFLQPDVWRELPVASPTSPMIWTTSVPGPLVPRDVEELGNWSLAWNLDTATSKGTYIHFLVRPTVITAVLSTHPRTVL